jgi:hypothetical protein
MFHKGLLQGVELLAFGHSFDGADTFVMGIEGKNQTGSDGFAIHQDGAGAALSFITGFFRSDEAKLVAQNLK